MYTFAYVDVHTCLHVIMCLAIYTSMHVYLHTLTYIYIYVIYIYMHVYQPGLTAALKLPRRHTGRLERALGSQVEASRAELGLISHTPRKPSKVLGCL